MYRFTVNNTGTDTTGTVSPVPVSYHFVLTVCNPIFDRYDNENSVKVGEREQRADAGEGSRKYHVMGGRPVPP